MKNLFLIAFMLIGTFAFAANTTNDFSATITITTVCEAETTEVDLSFDSQEDFTNFDTNQIPVEADYPCTVDVTVTVSVGAGETYASVTLTAKDIPCEDVSATMKSLIKSAREAIR